MRHEAEMKAILKQVELWPADERAVFARELNLIAEALPPLMKPSIDELVGAGKGEKPIPSDEDLKRWRDEHLMMKYGR